MPLVLSCASQINGSLGKSGQAELNVSIALQPRMAALIRNLSAATGSAAMDAPVLDGALITRSLSAAPGVASVAFRNTTPDSFEGPVRISHIGDLLAPHEGTGFISFEQTAAGGRCVITLSRESGPGILSLISPEMSGYLGALMAPLATGEQIGQAEYLSLVSAVYGRAIADEIAQSSIRASIEAPGPVQSVQGGTFLGRRADFAIPLLDLLVLETPLSYELVWK
jgi:hypothetical protein